jgi:serine protease Do
MPLAGRGEIAERLRRSTVLVRAGWRGGGSGVIWSPDGTIVTNAHVLRGDTASVQLWDGSEYRAAVALRDRRRDLALLRIAARGLPAADPGDSSRLRVGEIVLAVGNPFGFVGALTTGVVHGTGPLLGLGPQSWIHATVRLAPGNSGGPLANALGQMVGINTMVAGSLALAIPSNAVQRFLSSGKGSAWLGVTLRFVLLPANAAAPAGLLILGIDRGSPAASASLLPGDILLGTEETPFGSMDDLADVLAGTAERTVRLRFLRGDYERIRRVTVQIGGTAAARGKGTQAA